MLDKNRFPKYHELRQDHTICPLCMCNAQGASTTFADSSLTKGGGYLFRGLAQQGFLIVLPSDAHFGDRYDWTTEAPDNGNDRRKFCVVPRLHPLRSLLLFNRGGNRRAFRLPGAGGDHFHCAVEPSRSHSVSTIGKSLAISNPSR